MLKFYYFHTICYNSDMFQSTLIIVRELLNINEVCVYIYIYIYRINEVYIHTYIYKFLLIFSNSQKMIKTEWNMLNL